MLSTVKYEYSLPPGCAFAVEGAVVGSRGDKDTTLRMNEVEPEYA